MEKHVFLFPRDRLFEMTIIAFNFDVLHSNLLSSEGEMFIRFSSGLMNIKKFGCSEYPRMLKRFLQTTALSDIFNGSKFIGKLSKTNESS